MKTRNPRRSADNFRLQTYIEEELAEAKKLEKQDHLSSDELIDIALAYLEIGDWKTVRKYVELALEQEKTNKEINATAHYINGTINRELNDCKGAHADFKQANDIAKSDWLKVNIQRNEGLTYLKEKEFEIAATTFQSALDFASKCASKDELRGCIPALSNYFGLSQARAAIKLSKDPAQGLATLENTTQLYETIFAEKKITESERRKSHDWQSHQFHRGMILCEIAETKIKEEKTAENMFQQAETLLLGALVGRIENKADEQRLGDVCGWLGRTYAGFKQYEKSQEYFEKALNYYKVAFATATTEVSQIKDINTRLENLIKEKLAHDKDKKPFADLTAPISPGQGVFAVSPARSAIVIDTPAPRLA